MMELKALEKHWQEMSSGVATEMADWRRQHPRATLKEIETALDERMARLRAKMLEEAALQSPLQDWRAEQESEMPRCSECDEVLEGRTMAERRLQTHGGEMIELERRYGVCPKCKQGFFPPG